MATPVDPAPPKPAVRDPHTGGVMYVGPSLTRSLLGVAIALTRATA